MIVSRAQMVEAEQTAFARGARAEDLMEIAGAGLATFLRQLFPVPGHAVVFAGKGHNGGDVLVAARHLADAGWSFELHPSASPMAPLTRRQWESLPETRPRRGVDRIAVLDGVLGIGARGEPSGEAAEAIRRIQTLRALSGATVIAADVPSGLDADSGTPAAYCVEADATVTMGFVKQGLLADAATRCVGRLALVPLDLPLPERGDTAFVLTPAALQGLLPPRPFETHKGQAGRVLILAGSEGFTGAARLCSEAAARAGAGLVTLAVPREIYPIVAASAAPEVMVHPLTSLDGLLDSPWNAIAIGPGLGRSRDAEVRDFLSRVEVPCVVDADALNALSAGRLDPIENPPGPRLLTPHPGEMERLFPCAGRSRRQWMEDFVDRYPVTLLLKGARTVIGRAGIPTAFNTTGHPGMAGGGMGDVLTGVCAALIGAGLTPDNAARCGAWVCGHAAELAIRTGASQESLRASDVLDHLGPAFTHAREGLAA